VAYVADGVRIPDTVEVHPFAWIGAGVECKASISFPV